MAGPEQTCYQKRAWFPSLRQWGLTASQAGVAHRRISSFRENVALKLVVDTNTLTWVTSITVCTEMPVA